jgi:glutaredoxin 3|tara:strand:- start:757 stop:981 length:225 start_codon:yes stop_codon:yes gene_type:complete
MIEIWSKPQCPFCDKAENLCIQKDFEYKKYMLDEDFSRDQFMEKFPTARTFPQILIDGKLIGGYTEFAAEVGIE